MVWPIAVAVALAAGSIPFGYIIARAHGIDIRAHGSGNIGATNVGRIVGRGAGRLCLVLDMLKGFGPALGAGMVAGVAGETTIAARDAWWWVAVLAATVAGHMYSPWLGFRGGKGVATGFGAMLGVWPWLTAPALMAAGVWLVAARVTRYVGVSSCAAAISLPVWVTVWVLAVRSWGGSGAALLPFLVMSGALAMLVVWRHRGNLSRTLRGVEPRMDDPPPGA